MPSDSTGTGAIQLALFPPPQNHFSTKLSYHASAAPGGAGHVDSDTPKRLYEESAILSRGNLLALLVVAFVYAVGQGDESIGLHLAMGQTEQDIKIRVIR